jgi:hypothetical protein
MNNEFSEPEERDLETNNADVLDDNFNPLDEPVIEKAYTKHNVKIDARDFQTDIPEPSLQPPPMSGGLTEEEKVKKNPEPFNREFNQMSNKDKHDSSGKLADMILSGYKWANTFADSKLLFDQQKLAKLQKEGEIDLSVEIPISPSQTITAGEFIQEYNEQTKGTISVSDEFEQEVKPVLTRVLEKRGIGLTDEQQLIYLFSKDILVKGFMMRQSLNVKKEMLETLKEATQSMRGVGYTPQMQSAPPPTQNTTYKAEPIIEEDTYEEPIEEPRPQRNPDTNVNDFVNEMTGAYQGEPEYEKPIVITETKKKSGKRGRPKKK